jgi:hypothetical protein
MRDPLVDVVLGDLEVVDRQPLHEPPAVGDDDRHLNDVDVHALRDVELPRPHRLRQLLSVVERCRDAEGVLEDPGPGIPLAFERRPLQLADQLRVGKELDPHHARERRGRLDDRAQKDGPADERVVLG